MRRAAYWISGPWLGHLAIIPRPRGGDWLGDEVRALKDLGLNIVVSLLTREEIIEFELAEEEQWCQAQGIQFHTLAIPDRGVPESRQAVADLIETLMKALEAGKSIGVHCRQGIGRSSVVAALLLVSAGEGPDTALAHISQARGCPVPDTPEQANWIKGFAVLTDLRQELRIQ